MSLPVAKPRDLFAIGEALRPLRSEGVLIVGSGGIVHNLRRVDIRNKELPPEPWAETSTNGSRGRIEARQYEALFEYRKRAPHAAMAVPTPEHFDPIFITLGAAFPEERPANDLRRLPLRHDLDAQLRVCRDAMTRAP